jgi:glyoxylase-like metal-dependent hydrolase (beta-lactamase superfamily II)
VIGAYERDGVIVDPGPASSVAALDGIEPRALLLTHIHLDHAGATGVLRGVLQVTPAGGSGSPSAPTVGGGGAGSPTAGSAATPDPYDIWVHAANRALGA